MTLSNIYTVYWLNGCRQIVSGENIYAALEAFNHFDYYGRNHYFYFEGVVDNYVWDEYAKRWNKRGEFIKDDGWYGVTPRGMVGPCDTLRQAMVRSGIC